MPARSYLSLSAFRVALLATLAVALLYLPASQLGMVQQVEGALFDLRLRLRPARPASDAIVLVVIDDESLAAYGRWPWSRRLIADLVGRLRADGARTIGLDLLLAEPESASVPAADLAPLLRDNEVPIQRLSALLAQADGDRRLTSELERADVVMPILFTPTAADQGSPPPFVRDAAFRVVQEGAAADLGALPQGEGLLAPIRALGRVAAALGHVNAPLDRGGAQRFEYPVIAYGADYYPSFSLEIARRFLGVERDRTRLLLGQGVALGNRFVPTDESMRLPIRYQRSRFPTISAAAVLDGSAEPAMFAGKVVLIGGTAAGVGKTFATPFWRLMPEVERHATVLDNLLSGDLLVRREAWVLVDLAVVVVFGILLGWVTQRFGVPGAAITFLLAALGLTGINLALFARLGWWLNLFLPLAVLGVITFVVLAYSYFLGKRQERTIRAAFEHYLSPDLVDLVCRDPGLLRLGGERRELTVLFADIRGSTALAQQLAPDRFAQLLNEVLEALTGAVFARGGMLDKFTGDGLLALFGAPLPQEDHASRACYAALDMMTALQPVRERWSELAVPLEIGVGINSGPMIIGNMGSRQRFTYTVIGDEAHLGARLEAANKDFRTRILISEATYGQVRDQIAARELDVVKFRGLEQPVRVFELLGERPLPAERAALLERYEAAMMALRGGDPAAALRQLETLQAEAPDDRPLQIAIDRCQAALRAPAPRAALPL